MWLQVRLLANLTRYVPAMRGWEGQWNLDAEARYLVITPCQWNLDAQARYLVITPCQWNLDAEARTPH